MAFEADRRGLAAVDAGSPDGDDTIMLQFVALKIHVIEHGGLVLLSVH